MSLGEIEYEMTKLSLNQLHSLHGSLGVLIGDRQRIGELIRTKVI